MLAHLAFVATLIVTATHLTLEPPGSPPPVANSQMGTVILTAPDPDATVAEPGRCLPASTQPAYRDLSGMALIPPASSAMFENRGPHP